MRVEEVIKINDVQAAKYLAAGRLMMSTGVEEQLAFPYIVMVKGYGDDWDEYSELTLDDLDNENVIDAGYEDYELWLNDTLTNLKMKGDL